tara:strand:- start:1782 stop:1937 length:156 start_codon:yes stop_codon:yes gene_type:complete
MEDKDLDKEIEKLKNIVRGLTAKEIISKKQVKDFKQKLNKVAKKLKDENKT